MKRMIAVLCIAATVILTGCNDNSPTASTSDAVFDTIESEQINTQAIRLTNNNGDIIGLMRADDNGQPSFSLHDKTDSGKSASITFDEHGNPAAILTDGDRLLFLNLMHGEKVPTISFFDDKGDGVEILP